MTEVKRLNYFDRQFLHVADFRDEQTYHINMRRLHNQLLHTWGSIDGLSVTEKGAKEITIQPGHAFDRQGREIVLSAQTDKSLPDWADSQEYWLTIAYGEQETDKTDETGAKGFTRCTEEPKTEWSKTDPDPDHSDIPEGQYKNVVVLAKVSRTDGKPSIDTSDKVRKTAGVKLGDAAASSLSISGDANVEGALSVSGGGAAPGAAPTLHVAANRVDLTGSLSVSGDINVEGALTVKGEVTTRQLHVVEDILLEGR
jgi:hypothetical protein